MCVNVVQWPNCHPVIGGPIVLVCLSPAVARWEHRGHNYRGGNELAGISEAKPYLRYDNIYKPDLHLAPDPTGKFVVEGELTVDWDAMSLDDKSFCAILNEHLNFDPVRSSWGRIRLTVERLK